VLEMVEQVAELKLDIREEPRRAGDPPTLVAAADRIREVLGWQPEYDDLKIIVETSLNWERRLLEK
jgi:UDP-glucose 4-epimerase